jgi:hypothetical protein
MSRSVLAIVTDTFHGAEPIDEIRGRADGNGLAVRVVVPAVEANVLRHTLGDVDEPKELAGERLRAALALLRAQGVEAIGAVGDPDPIQAAQDALLESPADEVLIFEHGEGQARWYEDGLFDRAQESIEPPLRMIVLESDGDGGPEHVVEVEEAGVGTVAIDADKEVGSAYLPGLSRADLAGMVCGITGTIVAIVLAAAVTGSSASEGWEAVAILVAIGIALINMAHVVGLTLMESVRYRGGFAVFFRTLALVGTPLAVLVNLLILILA